VGVEFKRVSFLFYLIKCLLNICRLNYFLFRVVLNKFRGKVNKWGV